MLSDRLVLRSVVVRVSNLMNKGKYFPPSLERTIPPGNSTNNEKRKVKTDSRYELGEAPPMLKLISTEKGESRI